MYEFTKAELSSYYYHVAVLVANHLEIQQSEWKSRGELGVEIKTKNPEVSQLLSEFYKAYQAWYDYCYQDGSSKITGEDNNCGYAYIELSKDRDEIRNRLIDKLNSLHR